MKKLKLFLVVLVMLVIGGCRDSAIPSDSDYPIGTVVYIMPDSTKAVACGGYGLRDDSEYLWIQYTSKMGEIETDLINKKLIY